MFELYREFDSRVHAPERQYWKWKGAPDWKNERMVYIQDELYKRGFSTEEVYAVSLMAIQESGLNTNANGDNGCSEGIWQRNKCVHGKNPHDFNNVDENIEYIAGRMRYFFDKYPNDIDRAIIAHNSPAKASSGAFSKYLNEVRRHEAKLK